MPWSRFRGPYFRVKARPERVRAAWKSPHREKCACIWEDAQQGEILMKRRDFLKVSAAGGAAAGAVTSAAIAQSSPEIKWRMTSSFPKSLDTLYNGATEVAKYVAEMNDHKIQMQV